MTTLYLIELQDNGQYISYKCEDTADWQWWWFAPLPYDFSQILN